jgi:hypothetical protein
MWHTVVLMMMMMTAMIVRIRSVIMRALKLDKVARTIKLKKAIAVTVGNIMLMHITRALFRVAYHQVEEVILHVMTRLVALPNSFYFKYFDID